MTLSIHADRRELALVDARALPWSPSPEAGVERRMLERSGGEVALATSIVRYLPGSRFPAHTHDLGEEFLVLEGTFSDADGDYPAGTYVRNPPGSTHAPYSCAGCVIFVKLRQMQPHDAESLRVFPEQRRWTATAVAGIQTAVLHAAGNSQVSLLRFAAGSVLPARPTPGGEELLLIDGEAELLDASHALMHPSTWRRSGTSSQPAMRASADTLLWVKRGHL